MPEITSNSISVAWREAVIAASTQPKRELHNLILNVENIHLPTWAEKDDIRAALDVSLSQNGKHSTATVANTIFPHSLWNPHLPQEVLYERYLRLWPRLEEYRQNRRGTYFQRLINFPRPGEPTFNQLDRVIAIYNSGVHRRSALQCSILVPYLDLNPTPYQGFPCMQQVAFLPDGSGGLRNSALYPMHYLWERAWGNYLGLINLGRFVAHEINLELRSMSCVSLVAKMENAEALEVVQSA